LQQNVTQRTTRNQHNQDRPDNGGSCHQATNQQSSTDDHSISSVGSPASLLPCSSLPAFLAFVAFRRSFAPSCSKSCNSFLLRPAPIKNQRTCVTNNFYGRIDHNVLKAHIISSFLKSPTNGRSTNNTNILGITQVMLKPNPALI
jgi:hypothetical protein